MSLLVEKEGEFRDNKKKAAKMVKMWCSEIESMTSEGWNGGDERREKEHTEPSGSDQPFNHSLARRFDQREQERKVKGSADPSQISLPDEAGTMNKNAKQEERKRKGPSVKIIVAISTLFLSLRVHVLRFASHQTFGLPPLRLLY